MQSLSLGPQKRGDWKITERERERRWKKVLKGLGYMEKEDKQAPKTLGQKGEKGEGQQTQPEH